MRLHAPAITHRSGATSLPVWIEPMLAVSTGLPPDPQNWAFEYKWDGVRCFVRYDRQALSLFSRNHIPITQRYPELAGLGASLGRRAVILDSEIIAFGEDDRPSFAELQRRMHVDHPTPALVKQTPVWCIVFDLLHLDGASTLDLPYLRRRELLAKVFHKGPNWQVSAYHVGDGAAMLAAAQKHSMEGVVAKLCTGPYEAGRRSPLWRKIKVVFGQEFVIGAWLPQETDRPDRVGALLLGYHEPGETGLLRYAGRVGTGFSDETHARLIAALRPIETPINPFSQRPPGPGVRYVRPTLVAEVQYRRWPTDGLIQQASFKGLRTDKPAHNIIREIRGAS